MCLTSVLYQESPVDTTEMNDYVIEKTAQTALKSPDFYPLEFQGVALFLLGSRPYRSRSLDVDRFYLLLLKHDFCRHQFISDDVFMHVMKEEFYRLFP